MFNTIRPVYDPLILCFSSDNKVVFILCIGLFAIYGAVKVPLTIYVNFYFAYSSTLR